MLILMKIYDADYSEFLILMLIRCKYIWIYNTNLLSLTIMLEARASLDAILLFFTCRYYGAICSVRFSMMIGRGGEEMFKRIRGLLY